MTHLVPGAVPLGGDDIMQGLQSGTTLANYDELISTLKCVFRLLKDGSTVIS